MTKLEKLLQKAQNSPNNIRFKDVIKQAKPVGFVFKGQKETSHRICKLPGTDAMLNFQNHNGKAVPYQVKQLLDRIETHNLLEGRDE